jgi:hypothetical protein
MAVPDATENRILDALLPILQGIGTPAGSWLTAPEVAEGIPPDSVPVGDRLYVHHVRTDEVAPEAGTSTHYFRARFAVWIFAETVRRVCQIKADVLRALFAGETALTSAFGQPVWPSEFIERDDLSSSGQAAGRLEVFLDVVISHSAP